MHLGAFYAGRMTRVLRAVAAAALLVALVTGCTADDVAQPGAPTPTPVASPDPEPLVDTDHPWELTTPVGRDGSAGLHLQLWPTQEDPAVLGSSLEEITTVTIHPDRVDLERPISLGLTTSGSLALTRDGGLTVQDGSGTVVAGIAPLTGGARFALDDETTARIVLPLTPTASPSPPAQPPAPVTLAIGHQGLVSAEWRERSDGPSLFVDPTPWARTSGEAGWALAWAELVAAHPDADTQVMHDQLVCHGIGAVDKETWNLEPWRPDIGLLALMAARCNPPRE